MHGSLSIAEISLADAPPSHVTLPSPTPRLPERIPLIGSGVTGLLLWPAIIQQRQRVVLSLVIHPMSDLVVCKSEIVLCYSAYYNYYVHEIFRRLPNCVGAAAASRGGEEEEAEEASYLILAPADQVP